MGWLKSHIFLNVIVSVWIEIVCDPSAAQLDTLHMF